ncbi:MAG: phosphopantothenoylcysteine decarboxylase, partial [Elusimicrobiota bacterium]
MSRGSWRGLRVLITAGPTREYLDPVRFLTNASSGKMAFALARLARRRGARVTLVSGPTAAPAPRGLRNVPVVSAEQMRRRVLAECAASDVLIGAAAVGDWRFSRPSARKIKREGPLRVTLIPTQDIIAEVGRRRARGGRAPRVLVGFALESGRPLSRARAKLSAKGLDLVVANGLSTLGADRA